MTVPHLLTFGVLAGTVGVLVWRPRHLNEGLIAALGGLIVLLLGAASLEDVWRGASDTAEVLIFLIAMMVVAVIAEEAGCFEWAAMRALTLSRGDGRLLYVNLYLLGALVTIFLSLDVTAIMIAPIVVTLARRARLDPLPFVVACAYVANTASLFLPVSNLTNMLVYSLIKVPFWAFVRWMTLPNLMAMAVNLLIFFRLFRRRIPRRFELSSWEIASEPDLARLRLAGIGLAVVVIGLLVFGALGLPLYLPALAGALVLTPLALSRGDVTPDRLWRGVAWSLPLFVVGMDTVVVAADRAGLHRIWQGLLIGSTGQRSAGEVLLVALATAAGANLVNNIPMALVVITGLTSTAPPDQVILALASLIGTNVGPNVSVFGSLATLLVLHAARRRGVAVRARDYLLIGLLTTPPMILAAAITLWALTANVR